MSCSVYVEHVYIYRKSDLFHWSTGGSCGDVRRLFVNHPPIIGRIMMHIARDKIKQIWGSLHSSWLFAMSNIFYVKEPSPTLY